MGVKDLLKAFQSEARLKMITEFRGKRIAIDASGWLHKGLYAAAEDFVDSGIDSQLYVDFILARARNFLLNDVEPVFIFDGRRSILKTETCHKRNECKELMLESGRKLVANMARTSDPACRMKLRQEALACFQKGLDVTHEMEIATIAGLRRLNIQCFVAPYEADAQLAYLCRMGYCDAVLTEDSDLLVYSAVCGVSFPVLYKFDKDGTARCLDLESIGILEKSSNNTNQAHFSSAVSANPATKSGDTESKTTAASTFRKSLKEFRGPTGRRMFVQMCILAGTDYIESISGVGIVTAQQAVVRSKTSLNDERIQCALNLLGHMNKTIPDGYVARAGRVEALFHYQPVYNPVTKTIETLMPRPDFDVSNDEWAGPKVNDAVLRSLGSEEDLMGFLPADMTIEDMCEARRSYKTFDVIDSGFPWERGKLTTPNGPESNLWVIRRNMIHYIDTHGGTMIQSGKFSIANDAKKNINNNSIFKHGCKADCKYQVRSRSSSLVGRKSNHNPLSGKKFQSKGGRHLELRNEIPSFEQFTTMATAASIREIMHPPELQNSSSLDRRPISTQLEAHASDDSHNLPTHKTLRPPLFTSASRYGDEVEGLVEDSKNNEIQEIDESKEMLNSSIIGENPSENNYGDQKQLSKIDLNKIQNVSAIEMACTPRTIVIDNINDEKMGVTKISPTEKLVDNVKMVNSFENTNNKNKMKFEEKFPRGVPMQPSPKRRKIEAVSIQGKKSKGGGVAATIKVASIKSFFS